MLRYEGRPSVRVIEMGLWAYGKSPDTSSLADHEEAHAWARKQEEKALKICKKCKQCKSVSFSLRKIYVCDGIPAGGNNSARAISIILNEGRCLKGKSMKKTAKLTTYQVKDGKWKSKKYKTLAAAERVYEECLGERHLDGSGDAKFGELTLLKNGEPMPGY